MIRGFIYRKWSKLIHKYGYHYAPRKPLPEPHKTRIGIDGLPVIEHSHWCHWCGLRGKTIEIK